MKLLLICPVYGHIRLNLNPLHLWRCRRCQQIYWGKDDRPGR